MATNNKKAGGKWKETRHDKFYHLAKEQGYRSRAAFKLIQLNKKYNFLSGCKSLVDLGAAPGGWLQVAQKYMPVSSLIIGMDLLPIRPIRGVTTLQGDITTEQAKKLIKQELQTWDVDVVVHDGAPNVAGGGSWAKDAYLQNDLVIHSLRLATTVLRQGGWFVTKVFRSQDYNSVLWVLQQFFKKVEVSKPAASRNASAEIFIVCQGYLAPKKIDAKLLDPNVIFQNFEDEASKKKPDVFSAKQPKRLRSGYDDVDNMIQTKRLDILQFLSDDVDQTTAIRYLGDYNQFTFEKAPTEDRDSLSKDLKVVAMSPSERKAHDDLLEVVLNHAATTDEIKELCRDLKVLGKGDFKSLLKYRKAIQTYLVELEIERKKADGTWEREQAEKAAAASEAAMNAEENEPKLTEEEQFELELKQLRIKKLLEQRKEKKKKREAKAKAAKRSLVNLHNMKESGELVQNDGGAVTVSEQVGGEDGLFTLRTIKNKDSLDYVAETEGKGKLKKGGIKAATAEEDEEDDEEDDDEDELSGAEDEDEGELYREILQAQREAFDESVGRRKNKNLPMNQYEDEEEALLAKIRARDAKKTKNFSSASNISINNVRGDDDAEDYYEKLERDLDFMYEQYKDRREIKAKNRNGGSELDMGEEEAGQTLLSQARKEEQDANAKTQKRKRGDDSDSSDEEDMDRFNSESSEEDEEEEEKEQSDEEDLSKVAKSRKRRGGDSSSSDEENENPLLRKLAIPSKPTTQARVNRWFQRGLLAEAAADEEAAASKDKMDTTDEADTEAQPEESVVSRKRKANLAAAASYQSKAKQQPSKKQRKMVDIDAGADSSEEDDAASQNGGDADMGHSSDEEGDENARKFFSNGKEVRTKSGLKPNSVLGLDGLKKSVKDVQSDVIDGEGEGSEKKKKLTIKEKITAKKAARAAEKAAAAPKFDEDGDVIDSLKEAEKLARAKLKKTTKNYKAQEKARADSDKEKAEAFEVVPVAEDAEDEAVHFSSDDDAIAERLALGRHMLAKKSRNNLINDSYNRYSMDPEELSGLPEWFVRDEGLHHTPILPVTKAEVDTYKEQLRAINTRPIKKIAEAKARKQVKTQKRWEKIKAQAEVIANQEGGNSGEKLRQIEKLFHQKSLKKEKKERVYVVTLKNGKTATPKSSKGRKGKVVKVDTRMKKDKRGEKRAASRAKKSSATKNKKKLKSSSTK